MLVHSWDLATALGHPRDLVPDLAESALPVVRELYGSLPRTPGGSFAPPQEAPRDAMRSTASPATSAARGLSQATEPGNRRS
ncbi:hypothetical protein [Streptomyces sp. NRRL S-1448]|uniref:hypothetical protein n=1 Tax=Streptomyces sp. NRRL S-1448 TaxID=1463883 RepID=UPI0004BF34D8|nr:hypothetical protein [Streptomyces sp. NRRL S-1448]